MTYLLPIAYLLACASAPDDPFVVEEDVTGLKPQDLTESDPVHVLWTVLPVEGRKNAEKLGRIAVAMEATLYQTVIPQGPGGAPPGVTYVPETQVATLELRMDADAQTEASFCTQDGICEIYKQEGSPEQIGVGLGRQVTERLGLVSPPLDCLLAPPSENAYASMMAGRSAAIVYGLMEPQGEPGDVRSDPIERAVFLDPAAAGAQWLATRTAWQRDDGEKILEHATLAAKACPTHNGWAADAALIGSLLSGRSRPFPKDVRFDIARIDAAYARKAPETFGLIEDARKRWPQSALLAQRAADTAPEPKLDNLLKEWSTIDKSDPEPVRRMASRAILASDWKKLLQHCDELEKRGEDSSTLAMPALLALGRFDEAARRAPPNLRPLLEARRGGPAVGSSPEMLLLMAERRVSEDPTAALALTRQVLAARPTWPEALIVAEKAARNAGIDPTPYQERLAEAEP
jgi:hypothetical protein